MADRAQARARRKRIRERKGRFNGSYLTKEGFRNIRIHRLMSVASVAVMMSCLLLVGGAYLIFVNIQAVIDKVGEQNVVMVFIEDDASAAEEAALGDAIKKTANVSSCDFVSRDDSYAGILSSMGDSADIMENVDSSFLPDAYKVTVTDMTGFSSTVKTLSELDNVLTVRENTELAEKLASIQKSVGLISISVAVILLVVSLFIIANTVRITMFSRSLEISIMKAVGATNRFIRWPFLVEGFVIGIISAAFGFGIVYFLYLGADMLFGSLFDILGSTMVPFENVTAQLLFTFMGMGIVTGVLGSAISLNRYLKEHGKVVE